ncbi:MAG: hypothetical protein E7172_04885 [Firmicutes bacterium]|nr:hypothetical protein [Bacillota bacterium]
MFNTKFKKMLKKEFEEEYSYKGDYAAVAKKFEEEYGGVPKFNKKKYIRNVSFAFSFATLIVVLLAVFISGRVIDERISNDQKDIKQYVMKEEEVKFVSHYCDSIREKPIFYVETAKNAYISVYVCSTESNVYYFARVREAYNNIQVFFNDSEMFLKEGFHLLGMNKYDSLGKNLISFNCYDDNNMQEYVYDFYA